MGLRWEPQQVMKEIFGRSEQFRPDMYAAGVRSKIIPTAPAGEVFVGDSYNGIALPDTGQTADLNNFAPRLGIAWDVFGNGKTVVRSGGGVFYSSRLPGLFLNDASISQPFSLRQDLTEPSSPNNLIPFNNPLQSVPSFAAQFPLLYTLKTIPSGVVPFTGGGKGVLGNLPLLGNYTFSKAMEIALASNGGITDIGSSKGSGLPFGNPNQGRFDTGPAQGQDRTHRVVASFVWELPKLNGTNVAVRTILGGWQWSGLYSFQSGDAMTLLAGTDRSLTILGNDRADYIGPANQYGQAVPAGSRSGCGSTTCVPYLNTSFFALPASGTFGNVGKGAFRGPSRTNVDTGLIKNFFPFLSHEAIRFQLRGEFFNVFNHTELNDPTTARNSGNFGGIYGSADPRIIQLAAKVFF